MKKGLALIMVIVGGAALVYGVIAMFTGKATDSHTWIATILGLVFFSSGMGLLKNTEG